MNVSYPSHLPIGFILLIAASPLVVAQVDEPAYCPVTTTNTDGDGCGSENGSENGQPCRVLRNTAAYPVCSSSVLSTDPDVDGWGWEDDATCLVDNTSVENNYTLTNALNLGMTLSLLA